MATEGTKEEIIDEAPSIAVPPLYSQHVLMSVNLVGSPCPSQQENHHFNFNSLSISNINTPIAALDQIAGREISNLHPPKVRSRLTSTPNMPDICSNANVKSLLDDDLKDLSPTVVNLPGNLPKVKSCLHKRPMVDDPKGVLFPQQNHRCEYVICDNSINKWQTKTDENKNTDIGSFHLSRHLVTSFQDSGFESLGSSTFSQESASFINSPIKRKADDDITSVESPLKRLAFGALQTQTRDPGFRKKMASYDTSLPGCSFFCEGDERADVLETPPTPIFANSIQFSPGTSSKPISTDRHFYFMKPTTTPPRKHSVSSESESMWHTATSEISSHAGKTYFDIISHLAKRDLSHVIIKIFQSMRPKDVFRSSHVSMSWAAICRNNSFLQNKIRALKKQYRDDELNYGSENVTLSDAIKEALLKSPVKENSARDLSTGRSTLCNLQRRSKRTPTKAPTILLPTTPSGRNHYVPAENKYQHNQAVKRTLIFGETLRPCPKCGWTAKIYGDGSHKGLCYRYKCRFTFCTICKSSYHFPEQCSPTSLSPPSKEGTFKEPKIGTKKSRARLKKRLLM